MCRVDPASMTTATKMCLGEGLFISANATPSPPLAVSMVTAIQNAGKNNEVLRIGTKGCHGAQGFGETGINFIMLGNLTPGPFSRCGDMFGFISSNVFATSCKTNNYQKIAIKYSIGLFVLTGLRSNSYCILRALTINS